MKRVMQAKNKVTLLLLSGILLLCIGFIFTACGVGPVTKANNPDRGNYALDFTDCPAGQTCIFTVSATKQSYDMNSINGKPLTIEAWIKPKSTSTLYFLKHMGARGIALKTAGIGGNTTQVIPMLEIRRVVASLSATGTSSAPYTVSGTPIALNTWTHVAGILVNNPGAAAQTAHAAVHTAAGVACTGTPGNIADVSGVIAVDGDGTATNDTWHMDIYLGTRTVAPALTACSYTYGGRTECTAGACAPNEADPTAATAAFAHEPGGGAPGDKTIGVNPLSIVDETRIWTTDQSPLTTCYKKPLVIGGICDYTDPALLSYMKFNAGDGHFVKDYAGIFGTGGKEYPLGNDVFEKWNTGWTTDTPF